MDYLITDFGAHTGDILQTEQIQQTIDTCFLNGGGRVIVPTGLFRTGGLRLRSNVTLYLQSGAILEGSDNPEDYLGFWNDQLEPIPTEPLPGVVSRVDPFNRWSNALIRAICADNIAIIGEKGSYLNGVNCYDEQGEEGFRGPHAINFQNCSNITLKGYSIMHSANWAHAIFQSKNITASQLSVYGGHDGFDIRTCDNVLIEDCEFDSGDDCIAGFDNNDVFIRRCTLNTACNGMRFGGNHIRVEDCRFNAPAYYSHRYWLTQEQKARRIMTGSASRHNMVSAFIYYCDFRADIRKTPGDIVLQNCVFENPDTLFNLEFNRGNRWSVNRSLTSITFKDCRVTGMREPILIYGDAAEPITFTLENVEIGAREDAVSDVLMDATHYEKIVLKNVKLNHYTSPEVLLHSEGELVLENSTPVNVKKELES